VVCLFLALRVLWKTHPASNSFIVISEDEASLLDAMRFVDLGTIVAFRSSSKVNELDYGRVMRCDTLSRTWLVRSEKNGLESIVHECQLAGVEDVTKRRSIFAYASAPDSANDIEVYCQSASLGHLILILRWCNQFQSELQRSSNTSTLNAMSAIVKCLVEISSSLLSTEISLRLESNNGAYPNSTNDVELARQVLHLFSDETFVLTRSSRISNFDKSTGTCSGLSKFLTTDVSMAIHNLLGDLINSGFFENDVRSVR
jgi:hypothetical protein